MLLLRVIVSELWPIVTRVTPRNHIISCPHRAPAADLIARCAGAEEAAVFVERHGGSSVVMW